MSRLDDIFARTLQLRESRAPKTLGRWMARHYERLREHFEAMLPAPPDWEAFVVALHEHGISSPTGQPFKADTARRSWARVKQRASKRRLRTELAESAARMQPPLPLPPVRDRRVQSEEAEEVPVFRPATRAKQPREEG